MKIKNRETGQEVVLPDGRLINGWWSSDVKHVSYPATDWDEVKE